MVTSIGPATSSSRLPLRLRMVPGAACGRGPHGYWWPQSRDLPRELADLVDGLPPSWGKVLRAVYSPPDWDAAARRVQVGRGIIKAGCFPRDDTQRMQLLMWDHSMLSIVVIPPGSSAVEGSQALLGDGDQLAEDGNSPS